MSSIAPSSQSDPRSLIPPWLKGKWGSLGILFIIYTVLNLAWTIFHWGGTQQVILISNLLSILPSLLASIIAWRVAAQVSLSAPIRRAWFLLGLSFFMFLIGNLIWAYLEVYLHLEPFPSLADVFYLAFYPFALWGLLTLPVAAQNRRERLTLWLDLLSVLIAATMFVGYFIIIPTAASSNDLLTQIIAPIYPIGSLFLIGGILAVLYRRPSSNAQSALSLLLIGMLFFVGGDFAFGYTSLTGSYTPGGWTDASWNVAQLFFALAALRKMVHSPNSALIQHWITLRNKATPWLPLIAVVLAYGLVFYAVITDGGRAAEWLMVGALLLTLLVISRQIVSPAFTDLPIRVKVILTFLMVSVLSVCLVSATAYLPIHSELQSLAGGSLKAEVKVRAQTLGSELSRQLDIIEAFVRGETIEFGIAGANSHYTADQAAMDSQLQQQERDWKAAPDTDPLVQNVLDNPMAKELFDFSDNFSNHSYVLLTDKYGATVAATDRPDSYSWASEDWWQAAYAHGRGAVYLGQPTFDPVTRSFQVIMAVPVRSHDRQEVIGVLRTTVDIQTIFEMLLPSHSETQTGFSLLLPDGRLLNSIGDTQWLDADTMARLQDSQNLEYVQLRFEGTLQMLSQARLISSNSEDAGVFQDLNWTLIGHEKPAVTFAPLYSAWQAALLTTLFVLFLTSAVAVILSQVLIAPISRLTRVAAQIAAGDLTTQAEVESRDEVGTLASTFNTMLDALSHAQQELRESEALYRSLVDYSPDMIAVHCHGKYVFVNPTGVKLMGAESAEDLIGKQILDLVPADEREYIRQRIESAEASREPSSLHQRKLYRVDGTSFEAELRTIPIKYAGMPAIQLVARDITKRKQAEEALRESEEHYRLLFSGIRHGFALHEIICNKAGRPVDYRFIEINPAYETLTGLRASDLIGQTVLEVLPNTESCWIETFGQVALTGESIQFSNYSRELGKHYEVSAYSPKSGQFAIIFMDVTERKQAEMKLQISEERFRSLFENMLSGYAYCQMLYDRNNQPEDFIYISVNDSFEKITGLRNVAGRKVSEVIPGIQESNSELLEIYGRVAQTGKPERFETHIDSLGIWFSISVYSPKQDHFVAVFDNITERRQAEDQIHQLLAEVEGQKGDLERRVAERTEDLNTLNGRLQNELAERQRSEAALRISEEKYRAIFENVQDVFYTTDYQGQVVTISPSIEKHSGYLPEEIIGTHVRSFFMHEEHYKYLEDAVISQGALNDYEMMMKHKDGTLIYASVTAGVVFDETGQPAGTEGVLRNITERQRLVQSLRESEEQFRLLFEASPDSILLIDPKDPVVSWSIVDCNQVACHMNGFTREELMGQSIDVLNATPHTSAEREEYVKQIRQKGILHYEALHKHKDGHLFAVEVSTSIIMFRGRELILGIDRDITERKQSEASLRDAKDAAEESRRVAEAANRAKSEFLSRMSHELRTPMNAILGFAQLLEMSRKEPLTSTQKERVKQIVKGGQHLLDLINEILDISRIEANRLQISPEPVSIRDSIQEALDLAVPLAVKRHIQIVTKLGGMDIHPFVMADRQRFKQVLLNLLSNAVKYNYEGGSVIVSCQLTPANRWRISVADTGPGIPQDQLGRLFMPFERLVSDQSNVEGTGLGLVLAKRLVELMQGQIGVESIPGRGSTFWIELPSAESPVERLQRVGGTEELPALSAAARTILYVEDNIANFELIQQVLADYSQVELLWAADLKTGIELARGHHPNLILLDLHLAGMDGAEMLQQLKQDQETAEIPVVVVSADATPGQIERLIAGGAHAYLTKPLNVRNFIGLIEELLAEKEL